MLYAVPSDKGCFFEQHSHLQHLSMSATAMSHKLSKYLSCAQHVQICCASHALSLSAHICCCGSRKCSQCLHGFWSTKAMQTLRRFSALTTASQQQHNSSAQDHQFVEWCSRVCYSVCIFCLHPRSAAQLVSLDQYFTHRLHASQVTVSADLPTSSRSAGWQITNDRSQGHGS